MGTPLSPQALSFIREKVWAHIATVMKDGSPQVTPVWIETDGENLLVNTATGRLKTRNMERNPNVALSIMGMEDPYHCLFVRGVVKKITTEGANDQISRMALKYTGNANYQGFREGETRVIIVIEPLKVRERGLG